MFIRTDDPIADHMAWEREQEELLRQRPKCAICKEHIQDDTAVLIEGKYYCESCIEYYRVAM